MVPLSQVISQSDIVSGKTIGYNVTKMQPIKYKRLRETIENYVQ